MLLCAHEISFGDSASNVPDAQAVDSTTEEPFASKDPQKLDVSKELRNPNYVTISSEKIDAAPTNTKRTRN